MTDSESTGQILDPLTFPLHGSRLIEASAGTGKTFTIALLYVRLILGHEPVATFPRLLSPRDILVVTFTEAATKELRDRIRSRLAGAAEIFREDPAEVVQDQLKGDPLYALRQSYAPEHWGGCARRLELAAESMDESAVHTIHSWCYRMLREHAFESGGLFAQNLETDHSDLLMEVVRDYWRTFVYPLSAESTEAYLSLAGAPESLLAAMRPLMGTTLGENEPGTPAEHLEPMMAERRKVFETVRAGIPGWTDDFYDLFEQSKAGKKVNGSKLKINNLQSWLAVLREWGASESLKFPGLSAAAWLRLSPEGIEEAWKADPPSDHPLIEAVGLLDQQRESSVTPEHCLRHAAWWCARRMETEKQRRGEMGFDDLLIRLDRALQSPVGGKLAETIRSQFPVGLIDEFQDTDPVQYRIFETVFQINAAVSEQPPTTGFFMIGDPKQAIYGFRGADIHTYLSAREATAGRHYTLATNYRSAAEMVAASNHIFQYGEANAGQGAFGFGGSADNNQLPFYPVGAKGRNERLLIEGEPPAAMTIWQGADIGNNKADCMAAIAGGVASEITRLLNLGLDERAGFIEEGGALQPLCAADIAILVNNGQEAKAVRQALFQRGVRSVYLSDRASVLTTAAAGDVLLWLRACAEPERERCLRAALASGTLGLSWSRLDHLRRDELAWEAEIEAFRELRKVWQTQGVLAMIRRLLSRFDVPARLLTTAEITPDGERMLTDLLHIAELLQRESQHLDGEHALVRHFSELLSTPRLDPGAQQVRLESDESLVQVVTVHKSKGLEYPLVFLPFATSCRPVKGGNSAVVWHDDTGARQLTYAPDDDIVAKADQERLGEDVRKLYVALTRARHATWVGACALDKNVSASAMAYLVDAGEAAFEPQIAAMAEASPAVAVTDLPEGTAENFTPPPAPDLCEARTPAPRSADHWWIASYSAIRYQQEQVGMELLPARAPTEQETEPETAAAERMAEDGATLAERALPPLSRPPSSERRLHRFYRGAGPGTFLHNMLEWAAEQDFSAVVNEPAQLEDHLQSRCAVRGWSEWAQPLANWTQDYLQTPLPLPTQPDGQTPELILADCPSIYSEMEFWFAANHTDVAQIDQLVRQATLNAMPRPQAQPMQFNGMLKGFIDLVLEHDGRYYVMDYKSNYLGPGDENYTVENLAAAIADKRYDLQYVIYLLALHRLLRSRLPDYDYDQHIGGAVYSFLRGNGAVSRGIFADRPPRELIESLDDLMRGRQEQSSHQEVGEFS